MSIAQYKLKDGTIRWRVRFTKPDGRRTDERGFKTRTEARAREAELTLGAVPKTDSQPLRTFTEDVHARMLLPR